MPASLLDTATPLAPLGERIAVVVDGCCYPLGPEVAAFEREFADLCGARHANGNGNADDRAAGDGRRARRQGRGGCCASTARHDKVTYEQVGYNSRLDELQAAVLPASSTAGLTRRRPRHRHVHDLHRWRQLLRSLPNELFAYMTAGVPVVGSDFPTMSSLIQANGVGVVCDPDDPNAIASAIRSVTEDASRHEQLRQNGLRAARRFTWEQEGRKLVELVELVELVATRAR